MGDLVSKISVGDTGRARQTALRTLDSLVRSGIDDLGHYALFMSQFLDHIDGLELVEVRQIMDILSFMAHSRPDN